MKSLIAKMFGKKESKIVMIGLDGSGKTSILYQMKLKTLVQTQITSGFNVENIQRQSEIFSVWEIGGNSTLWKHYFANTSALVFVVDSSDSERIEMAKQKLQKALEFDELKDISLLVLANKMDKKGMTLAEISERLQLKTLKVKQWEIRGTSALTGEGIPQVLEWLTKAISKKK